MVIYHEKGGYRPVSYTHLDVYKRQGLKHATKEFVYYFDSDDILSPGLIESFYSTVSKYPKLDLFVFSAKSFSDSSSSDKLPEYDRGIDALFSDGKQAFSYLYSQDRCYHNALDVYKRQY
ncbi:glycosyltransferase family A protein [Klebsiella pneumoniae]|uniref:glycosyltransferase family A protein n=1 Tax=Klebsiella pneumoniae TaxID=573 RepID=UPI00111D3EEA